MSAPATAATPSLHWPGLLIGLGAVALILAGLSRIGDPWLPPVFGVALLLGAAFIWFDFGFAGGFRAWLGEGDGRALGADFIVPAVAALVVLPVGALVEGYGRFVAPIGTALILGAAIFGVGMQLANGCGSGSLVAAGQGSRRMWVTLPFFCGGGVLGTLLLPAAMRLPSFGAVDLPVLLGPWAGLAVTEALLGLGALLVLRGARPSRRRLVAGAAIGALAALLFLVSGMPWGITMGLTLWAAKPMQMAGMDLMGQEFWTEGWARAALEAPLMASHGALTDIGLLLGALLAAALLGRLRHRVPITWRGAAGAAIGGLLMGVGARLSFGCNVGAFLGGMSSGSLHGLIWIIATVPGCWLGIRLRPVFGLAAR